MKLLITTCPLAKRRLGSMLCFAIAMLAVSIPRAPAQVPWDVYGSSEWEFAFVSTHRGVSFIRQANHPDPINVDILPSVAELADFARAVLASPSQPGSLPSFHYRIAVRSNPKLARWDFSGNPARPLPDTPQDLGSVVFHTESGVWLSGSAASRQFEIGSADRVGMVIASRELLSTAAILVPQSAAGMECSGSEALPNGDWVSCPTASAMENEAKWIRSISGRVSLRIQRKRAESSNRPGAIWETRAVDVYLDDRTESTARKSPAPHLILNFRFFHESAPDPKGEWETLAEGAKYADCALLQRVSMTEGALGDIDILPKMVEEVQSLRFEPDGDLYMIEPKYLRGSLLDVPGLPFSPDTAKLPRPSSAAAGTRSAPPANGREDVASGSGGTARAGLIATAAGLLLLALGLRALRLRDRR